MRYILIIFLLFSFAIYSKDEFDEFDEDEPLNREIEFGMRVWQGYHSEDRFEGDLRKYKSVTSNLIYSSTNMEPFRFNSGYEFIGRYRLYKNWKAGIILGTGKFRKFRLSEIDSTGAITDWKIHLGSDYMMLGGMYEWFYSSFSLELGAALGVNTTLLEPQGYTFYTKYSPSETGGTLSANGLSYRMEATINKPIDDNLTFQIGIAGTWHTAPYFSGSLVKDSGSFYIRSDGSVGLLTESQGADSLINTELAVRKLDMFYGYFQIHTGITYKILF
ncbi:MAG: hypothetical protein KDK36_02155 [Leptospiraceae bacterium]|nr:hypothetical protein [Leptospiraceae bacterium]